MQNQLGESIGWCSTRRHSTNIEYKVFPNKNVHCSVDQELIYGNIGTVSALKTGLFQIIGSNLQLQKDNDLLIKIPK